MSTRGRVRSPDFYLLLWQIGNSPVTDKHRRQLVIRLGTRRRNFEIKNADAEMLLPFVTATVARADHNAMIGCLFATEINHGVSDGRVTIDKISPGPKEEIARFERVELEAVVTMREHGLEIAGLAHPDVLLARIARHIFDSALGQNVMNETGAIHPAVRRIGRAVFVAEILRR